MNELVTMSYTVEGPPAGFNGANGGICRFETKTAIQKKV